MTTRMCQCLRMIHTTLIQSVNPKVELCNQDIENVYIWCSENELTVNVNKYEAMHFGRGLSQKI